MGLRRRGLDILTAEEDGAREFDDAQLLARSTTLNRLLVTEDRDFSRITAQWLREGRTSAGVVRIVRWRLSIGEMLDDLKLLATALEPAEVQNRLYYLP